MNADEIPEDLMVLLDRAAGRRHSRDGAVAGALAEILTRYDDAILEAANYRGLALELAVRASKPSYAHEVHEEAALLDRARRFEAVLREGW